MATLGAEAGTGGLICNTPHYQYSTAEKMCRLRHAVERSLATYRPLQDAPSNSASALVMLTKGM
ncbi:MAG: hypothetical protein RBT70_08530 [Alphaproteobacteria bacterium]|jgi:hypothetical protein|nr:hypothetical protein [Alphaproteobacteria bacterium]